MVASPEGDVKATVEQPAVEPSNVPVAYIRPVAEGCERVRQELVKYPEWDANTMMAIAIAENRSCDPYNHNLTGSENHGVCVGSYGVLQVGCVHFAAGQDRNDTATVVAVAYNVWRSQGYRAWTMYRNGEYQKYL